MTADVFNIAPQAPRHSRGSWAALAGGFVLTSLCVGFAISQYLTYRQQQMTRTAAQAQQRALEKHAQEKQRRQGSPAELARLKMELRLAQIMGVSWSGIFEGLETSAYAVDGGVSLVNMTPTKRQDGSTQINLAAVAISPTAMLDYVRALDSMGRVKQVHLLSQQPEASAGPEGVRFRLSVSWLPSEPPTGRGS